MKTNFDLKLCPFCGGEPEVKTGYMNSGTAVGSGNTERVQCSKCGIGTPYILSRYREVRALWNKRAN